MRAKLYLLKETEERTKQFSTSNFAKALDKEIFPPLFNSEDKDFHNFSNILSQVLLVGDKLSLCASVSAERKYLQF